jgi:4-hydroxy-3-methylbut-2-enyl diphosphate reductase
VVTVEKALELYGPPIYVRKQIVHNVHVVADLERRGAIFVDETDEVPDGSRLVFSAHGVAPSVHEEAQRLSLLTIDATCPLVTKVHNEAKRFADSGYQILLIGHEGHEEVEGTAGEAPDAITIVDSPDAVDDLEIDPDRPVAWLSQTTLVAWTRPCRRSSDSVPACRCSSIPPSDDICYATQNRQAAVKEIAPQCDVVIVVGSENSSNSVRLAEVAQEAGARSYRIDDAGQLQPEWLEGAESVGVTSGASVPESLVEQLLDALEELGFDEIELVKTVEESLIFALPPELRRDIKAASAR